MYNKINENIHLVPFYCTDNQTCNKIKNHLFYYSDFRLVLWLRPIGWANKKTEQLRCFACSAKIQTLNCTFRNESYRQRIVK